MENTGKILFDDERAHWYVAVGEGWKGPFSASDLYQKILKQEYTWAHFIWKSGQSEWKRICEIKVFQALLPAVPTKKEQGSMTRDIKRDTKGEAPPPSPASAGPKWFLNYNKTQYGPFSIQEVKKFLKAGKIHGKVFGWHDGMSDWRPLDQITDLTAEVLEAQHVRAAKKAKSEAPAPVAAPSVKNQRGSPRRPLVARVLLAGKDRIGVAMCRDISVGGMQVLTDQLPGKVGDRIKLNVNPVGHSAEGVQAFVAEGVIVRILEDQRGFSFRFEKLSASAKKSIEDYLESADQPQK